MFSNWNFFQLVWNNLYKSKLETNVEKTNKLGSKFTFSARSAAEGKQWKKAVNIRIYFNLFTLVTMLERVNCDI